MTYSVARPNMMWKKDQEYATASSSLSHTFALSDVRPLCPPSPPIHINSITKNLLCSNSWTFTFISKNSKWEWHVYGINSVVVAFNFQQNHQCHSHSYEVKSQSSIHVVKKFDFFMNILYAFPVFLEVLLTRPLILSPHPITTQYMRACMHTCTHTHTHTFTILTILPEWTNHITIQYS